MAGPSREIQEQDGEAEAENSNKSRFHKASEQEIEALKLDAKAVRTHQQTRWEIKILRGRSHVFFNTTVVL